MASSSRLTREEVLRKKAEDEARRAGTLPAERDAKGRVINPHIPEYMKVAPWYMGDSEQVGLDHQRLPESQKYSSDINAGWYERGRKAVASNSAQSSAGSRSGSSAGCTNCGASTHTAKNCLEKPRKVGAAKLGARLAADDTAQPSLSLSYDGKRDNYNGFDSDAQLRALQKRSMLIAAQAKEVETKKDSEETNTAKKDPNLPKGSLRVRNDTAKYLRNLDPDSAFYDPKTRSMRANPTPNVPSDQLTFAGDNFVRNTGDAAELEKMEAFASMRSTQTSDASQAVQANPTALTLARKEFEARKEKLAAERRKKIEEAYGSSAFVAPPPSNLVLSSSTYSEYAPDGTVIKGMKPSVPSSCFTENVSENNHTQIWGSYFDLHTMSWGYGCCWQTIRNSYCTGEGGKQAAREAIARARPQESAIQPPKEQPHETKPLVETAAIPPVSAPSDLYGEQSVNAQFDPEKLKQALKRVRDDRKQSSGSESFSDSESDWSSTSSEGEKRHKQKKQKKSKKKTKKTERKSEGHPDTRKPEFHDVTAEDLEAYRLTKIHAADPMAGMLGKDQVFE